MFGISVNRLISINFQGNSFFITCNMRYLMNPWPYKALSFVKYHIVIQFEYVCCWISYFFSLINYRYVGLCNAIQTNENFDVYDSEVYLTKIGLQSVRRESWLLTMLEEQSWTHKQLLMLVLVDMLQVTQKLDKNKQISNGWRNLFVFFTT